MLVTINEQSRWKIIESIDNFSMSIQPKELNVLKCLTVSWISLPT